MKKRVVCSFPLNGRLRELKKSFKLKYLPGNVIDTTPTYKGVPLNLRLKITGNTSPSTTNSSGWDIAAS
jgi:hypothetical protein